MSKIMVLLGRYFLDLQTDFNLAAAEATFSSYTLPGTPPGSV